MGRKATGLNSIFIEYGSRVTNTSIAQQINMAAAALIAVQPHRASVTLPLSDQLKSYGLKFQTIDNKRLHLEWNGRIWKGLTMNKADLIREVAEVVLSRAEAQAAVECVLTKIAESLKNDEKVSIAGFGSFRVVQTKPRTGRHPKTGVSIQIPSKRVPKFTPAKKLKEYIK